MERILEAARRALRWAQDQSWYPERKVVSGAVTGILAALVTLVALDPESPIVVVAIAGAAAKITEYLVPAAEADTVRQLERVQVARRRRQRRRAG